MRPFRTGRNILMIMLERMKRFDVKRSIPMPKEEQEDAIYEKNTSDLSES